MICVFIPFVFIQLVLVKLLLSLLGNETLKMNRKTFGTFLLVLFWYSRLWDTYHVSKTVVLLVIVIKFL